MFPQYFVYHQIKKYYLMTFIGQLLVVGCMAPIERVPLTIPLMCASKPTDLYVHHTRTYHDAIHVSIHNKGFVRSIHVNEKLIHSIESH